MNVVDSSYSLRSTLIARRLVRFSGVSSRPEVGGRLRQDFGNGPGVEPPLFFGPLCGEVGHARQIFEAIKLDLPSLQANTHGSLVRLPGLSNKKFNSSGSQPGGENAVKRCRVTPLLQVS